MRPFITLFIVLVGLQASKANFQEKQQFIETYAGMATAEMMRVGIPASITLAQAALESNWGKGKIAVSGNNFFGIKCYNDWSGDCVQEMDDEVAPSHFRRYRDIAESFRDHSDFLTNQKRYRSLFLLPQDDYRQWAHGLRRCGYATDSLYAEKLIRLIEGHALYLYDQVVPVEQFKVLSTAVVTDIREEEPATAVRPADAGAWTVTPVDPGTFQVLRTPVVEVVAMETADMTGKPVERANPPVVREAPVYRLEQAADEQRPRYW
ncbi:MAG: hypothetical protein RLY31_679 [Bacteroidota bacterium]|jgi:hypothetical protein